MFNGQCASFSEKYMFMKPSHLCIGVTASPTSITFYKLKKLYK